MVVRVHDRLRSARHSGRHLPDRETRSGKKLAALNEFRGASTADLRAAADAVGERLLKAAFVITRAALSLRSYGSTRLSSA